MEEGQIPEQPPEHHVPVVEKQEEQKEEPKKEAKIVEKKGPGIFTKIKEKLSLYRRTLEVSRKPGKEEYMASVKITAIGILLLGFIGFVIYMIYHLVV